MSRSLRLAGAALVLLAIAGPASAQAQKKQPSFVTPPAPLRGPAEPTQPLPARPKPATPAAPDDQEPPASPALRQALPPRADTTARVGGLEAEGRGGAQCRSTCAQTYYFCLSNEAGDYCQTNWTQCLMACPTNSSSF